MKRSYNYTGRTRLDQKDFAISLYDREAFYEFVLTLNQDNPALAFPLQSSIKIEAYVGENIERFSLGTWGSPKKDQRIPITKFDTSENVKFRIKIVDDSIEEKPLLAWRDSVRPVSYDKKGKRVGILPVKPVDLRNRIWRLVWDGDSPCLQLNKKVSSAKDISSIAESDPDFASLVFPSIFEEIFLKLAKSDSAVLQEKENEWAIFASKFTASPAPEYNDEDDESIKEIENWVDECVEQFCYQHSYLEKYKKFKST